MNYFFLTPEPKPLLKKLYVCLNFINEVFLKFFVIGADNKAMGVKKKITAYQINNVLRVYREQLRRGRITNRKSPTDTNSPDKISISEKTSRKSIFDDIISNIAERITHLKRHENVQSEHGKPLPDNDGRQMKLIYKEIDENGETIIRRVNIKVRSLFR